MSFSDIREGADVYGSDGDKVGSIVAIRPNYLVVEKGFFFPTDYYIPMGAVASYQDGRVYLNVSKDAALNQGWDAIPADYDSTTTTDAGYMDTAYAGDSVVSGGPVGMQAGATAAEGIGLTNERLETAGTVRTGATVNAGETIAVPVHEEELLATKTAHQTGEVRIEKDVVAEERVLEVPVTEERVRVQRRVVDRPVTAADGDVFEEEVIEVPVYGEDVQLQKRVRVAEEVEIAKEAVQTTERVAGTVRREEVRIEDDVTVGAEGVIDDSTAVIDPSIDRGRSTGTGSGASGI
jgi:uncharacterized protein (TIGR02271 family)